MNSQLSFVGYRKNNELLSTMSTFVSIDFIKMLTCYGFYSMVNDIQFAMKSSTSKGTHDKTLPNSKLQSLNTISLQQLCNNKRISIHSNSNNKSEPISKLKLSLKQLHYECLFESLPKLNTLQYLNKVRGYPTNLTSSGTSILCFICKYLNIQSLLQFELCENVRKPHGLRHYEYVKLKISIKYEYNTNTKHIKYKTRAELLHDNCKFFCIKYSILELIRIDDNELLELFNEKFAIQSILKQVGIQAFISFGSHNNTLCITFSNTIINQLSNELFSFVLEQNNQIQSKVSNELCMELMTDNALHLLKEHVHNEIKTSSFWDKYGICLIGWVWAEWLYKWN